MESRQVETRERFLRTQVTVAGTDFMIVPLEI